MNIYRPRLASVLLSFGMTLSPIYALAQTANEPSPEEMRAWETVLISGAASEVYDFIETYPNGVYTNDAKALMIDLLWTDLSKDDPAPDVTLAATNDAAPPQAPVPEIVTALPTGEIELQSLDGFVAVSGVIIAFDDDLITVKTTYGTVGIENDGIACIGATCPTALLASQ